MHNVDFRSVRIRLRHEDFAIWSGPDEPPRDLVEPDVWKGITALPDDVSLRTSDNYGSTLRLLWDLWGEWISVVLALQEAVGEKVDSPIAHTACDVSEYLQAATYNALTGYYRLAHTSLRAIIENMTFGLAFQLDPSDGEFGEWLDGEDHPFDWAVHRAARQPRVAVLECHLADAASDSLYRQRHGFRAGGLARRLYKKLSKYAHGAPGHTDADVWHSNGPIFVPAAFEEWVCSHHEVYALAVLEGRLAQPALDELQGSRSPSAESLFRRVVNLLPEASEARRLFEAVPGTIWLSDQELSDPSERP